MENQREELKKVLLLHLNRDPGQYRPDNGHVETTCENFSFFQGEQTERPRCLLNEYRGSNGPYFDSQEAMEICSCFRKERFTKCERNGVMQPRPLVDSSVLVKKYRDIHEKYKKEEER